MNIGMAGTIIVSTYIINNPENAINAIVIFISLFDGVLML